jgi:flavin reductase
MSKASDETFSAEIAQAFKGAMRRLASTVTVITTAEGEAWHGMCATAVCSIGIAPPSLLISVAHTASIRAPLLRRMAFCVNLLGVDDRGLVGVFSGKDRGHARFKHGYWRIGDLGLPYLEAAQANVFCRVKTTLDHSGHTILVGEATYIRVADAVAPLIYGNGQLAKTAPLETPA